MGGSPETILWHDYETTGLDTRSDRPMSFAAVRTDLELQPVGEPLQIEFALAADVVPWPDAMLVTGLQPERAGTVTEYAGALRIRDEVNARATCSAGYNNVGFDDEVTRFLFWRNLLPAFEHEFRGGNSRFDLLDALRAACALRPEGMNWPTGERGWPSFKLSDLAAANGMKDHAAHDALGDVQATLGMARKLRAAQPELWELLFALRMRKEVQRRLDEAGDQPFVLTSRHFAASQRNTSLCVRMTPHPRFGSQFLCLDVRRDPQIILDHNVGDLRVWLFSKRDERPEGAPTVGAASVHTGRCPAVLPFSMLDRAAAERLELDLGMVERHLDCVEANRDALVQKLEHLYDEEPPEPGDIDQALYGGFLGEDDERLCRDVHRADPKDWRDLEKSFADPRLQELLFRLRARNHPELLWATEHVRWQQVRELRRPHAEAALARIAELRGEGTADAALLAACEQAIVKRFPVR